MIRNFLLLTLRLYQKTLSPSSGILRVLYAGPLLSLLPPFSTGCRFSPHCSEYAMSTLERERSVFVALRKIGTRLLLCHPFRVPRHP